MAVIQIRYSTTAGHVPSGLIDGQLAINIVDGILYWINASNALQSFNFLAPSISTPGGSDNSNRAANTSFVQSQIVALINGAPSNLNTLGEIAASINDDPNFAQTMSNVLVNCIRYDIAQTLNGAALAQVQSNIGLQSATINGGTF